MSEPATQQGTIQRIMGVHPLLRKKKMFAGGAPSGGMGPGKGTYPNLLYQGGPIVSSPQVCLVFLGNWSSAAARQTSLTNFVGDFLNSSYTYLRNMGVAPAAIWSNQSTFRTRSAT